MTIEERIAAAITHALSNTKKRGKDFASEMGVTPQFISALKKGSSKLGADKLWALAEISGVRPEWIATGNGPMLGATDEIIRYVPYYKSSDTHVKEQSNTEAFCPINKGMLSEYGVSDKSKIVAYKVGDDSMSPTLSKGDLILIDVSKQSPESGSLYAIPLPASSNLVIRRLVQNTSGSWIIRSDNPDKLRFSDEIISSVYSIKIAGRVIWGSGAL